MPEAGSKATSRPPRDVDAYLATLPEDARATLEKVRQTVKAAVPDAIEVISYQMPAFQHNGRMLLWIAAWKDHCSLYPISQTVRQTCEKELEAYETSKGTIRFPIGKPLSAAFVKKIVKARIADNETSDKEGERRQKST
jgi:uncharacterized protein YdhG (YjbR/CyaY superfamily)